MDKQRITDGDIIQPRAAKTREKILLTAIKLYAKNGYHDTTVDEIAKSAGLSVGTAYRYFKDKKDLLLAALAYGFEHIAELADVSESEIFGSDLDRVLTIFEKIHTDYHDLHEELEGLRHTDNDVRILYDDFMEKITKKIYDGLPGKIRNRPHSFQDLRIAIALMEDHCHSCMYGESDYDTVRYMRSRTLELADYLLSGAK